MRGVPIAAVVLLMLCACDTTKLTHLKEWACLDAERLEFNDPDSVKFVANLGTRGTDSPGFWVRYMAKNRFGAYVQGNIHCTGDSKENRIDDRLDEHLAVLQVEIELEQKTEAQRNEELRKKFHDQENHAEDYSDDSYERQANEIVYYGTGDLPKVDVGHADAGKGQLKVPDSSSRGP